MRIWIHNTLNHVMLNKFIYSISGLRNICVLYTEKFLWLQYEQVNLQITSETREKKIRRNELVVVKWSFFCCRQSFCEFISSSCSIYVTISQWQRWQLINQLLLLLFSSSLAIIPIKYDKFLSIISIYGCICYAFADFHTSSVQLLTTIFLSIIMRINKQ